MGKNNVIICFFILINVSNSQTLRPLSGGVDGPIYSLFTDTINQLLYAGGYFLKAGNTKVNCMAIWDDTIWSPVKGDTIDKFRGGIYAITFFNGDLYIGGNFDTIGDKSIKYISGNNGTDWFSLGTGVNNAVNHLAVFNSLLYVSGTFTNVDTLSISYAATWNGTNWLPVNGNNNNISYSTIFYVNGNELYTLFSNPCGIIAKWNGISWIPVCTDYMDAGTGISDMTFYNGFLYVCGGFKMINNKISPYISYYDGSGFQMAGCGGFNSMPKKMIGYNNQLYVFGYFTLVDNNIPVKGMAKYDGNNWNSVDNSIQVNSQSIINATVIYRGKLVIGGSFEFVTSTNDTIRNIAVMW